MIFLKRQLFSILIQSLILLTIAGTVWWPEYSHYQIRVVESLEDMAESRKRQPSLDTLLQVSSIDLMPIDFQKESNKDLANMIVDGYIDSRFFAGNRVKLIGWPADIESNTGDEHLILMSLKLEGILLQQFLASSETKYFDLAARRIFEFIEYESGLKGPVGLIWNDHAIAARVSVLIRFWMFLRDDQAIDQFQKHRLLKAVSRHAAFLSKKSHFTVQTNHGVMQNIALLQISAAFPQLAESTKWRETALSRLKMQLRFFGSTEGIILEHSPGYHLFGVRLMQYIILLYRLIERDVPISLQEQYESAVRYLKIILRPDCSLPRVGNTSGGSYSASVLGGIDCFNRAAKSLSRPDGDFQYVYPLSGYAIWGTGGASPYQVFLAWSKHVQHPHKHADETSIHLWSEGLDWITAVGYWGYDTAGYAEANGWEGSNAPHMRDEAAHNDRDSRLLFAGASNGLHVIDVETARKGGMKVRRQALQLGRHQLLVLDYVTGAAGPVDTSWTFDHSLSLASLSEKRFHMFTNLSGESMDVELIDIKGTPLKSGLYFGSRTPFAGWTIVENAPVRTHSLRIERGAGDSITGYLFTLGNAQVIRDGSVRGVELNDPEHWNLVIATAEGAKDVTRIGATVSMRTVNGVEDALLMPPEMSDAQTKSLRDDLSAAIQTYPRWKNYRPYRLRMLAALGLLFVVGAATTFLVRIKGAKFIYFDVLSTAGLVALGLWINLVYFV